MDKVVKPLVITVIIVAIIATGASLFYKYNRVSVPKSSPKTVNSNTYDISATHPNFVNATTFYTLRGEVDQIKGGPEGTLTLKSEGTPLPAFRITDETKVQQAIDVTTSQPARLSDVTAGKQVYISVNHDIQNNTWEVVYITLTPIQNNAQSASPSSTTR